MRHATACSEGIVSTLGQNIEVDQPDRFVTLIRDFLFRGEAFIVNPGDELAGVNVGAS